MSRLRLPRLRPALSLLRWRASLAVTRAIGVRCSCRAADGRERNHPVGLRAVGCDQSVRIRAGGIRDRLPVARAVLGWWRVPAGSSSRHSWAIAQES